MRKLLWVMILFSSLNAWGKPTLDLNKVKPDWRRVLDGQCVCQPVATAGGAVILTDGRKVLFLTDTGKIKWQSRLRLSRTSGDDNIANRGLVPLTEGFVIAFQGWNVFGINTDGQVVWKTQLSHKVQSIAATEDGLAAVCQDDAEKTAVLVMLGIRGKVRGAASPLATSDGNKSNGEDASTYGNIILPRAAKEPGAYTVMTGSGYLMLFEQSWLVQTWKVTLAQEIGGQNITPIIAKAMSETIPKQPTGLSAEEQQILGRFGEYLSLLATASRDKWRPNEYRSNLLDTCALIQSAADLELKSTSPMLARAIALETNSTTLTALFNAAAAQGYDEGELLGAIEKKARSIATDEEGTLIAVSDAVQSICLFMGGSARKAQAVKILTGLSNARYTVKTRARARAALAVLAGAN